MLQRNLDAKEITIHFVFPNKPTNICDNGRKIISIDKSQAFGQIYKLYENSLKQILNHKLSRMHHGLLIHTSLLQMKWHNSAESSNKSTYNLCWKTKTC